MKKLGNPIKNLPNPQSKDHSCLKSKFDHTTPCTLKTLNPQSKATPGRTGRANNCCSRLNLALTASKETSSYSSQRTRHSQNSRIILLSFEFSVHRATRKKSKSLEITFCSGDSVHRVESAFACTVQQLLLKLTAVFLPASRNRRAASSLAIIRPECFYCVFVFT